MLAFFGHVTDYSSVMSHCDNESFWNWVHRGKYRFSSIFLGFWSQNVTLQKILAIVSRTSVIYSFQNFLFISSFFWNFQKHKSLDSRNRNFRNCFLWLFYFANVSLFQVCFKEKQSRDTSSAPAPASTVVPGEEKKPEMPSPSCKSFFFRLKFFP